MDTVQDSGPAAGAGNGVPVPVEDNSHAGQGSVLLDIGGEIGALVLRATAAMEGVEIEIRPTGTTPYADGSRNADGDHEHVDHDDHPHEDDGDPHDHGPGHPHDHPQGHEHHGGTAHGHRLVHVAVLKRPSPQGEQWAAVFPDLHEGTYDLYVRPAEPVALSVTITGGSVTQADWPTSTG